MAPAVGAVDTATVTHARYAPQFVQYCVHGTVQISVCKYVLCTYVVFGMVQVRRVVHLSLAPHEYLFQELRDASRELW